MVLASPTNDTAGLASLKRKYFNPIMENILSHKSVNGNSGHYTQSALLAIDSKRGYSPMWFAAMHGCLQVVKYLVVLKKTQPNYDQCSIEDYCTFDSISAMMVAAIYGHADIVEYLLSEGADINVTKASGDTALHLACARGYERVIRVLLDHNADVSILNKAGMNPFVVSVVSNQYASVRVLLDYYKMGKIHLQLNMPHNGECLLSVCLSDLTTGDSAANNTRKEIAKDLISAGANKDVVDRKGLYTPLMKASATGHLDLVNVMLDGLEVPAVEVMMKGSKSKKIRSSDINGRLKANILACTQLGSALNVCISTEVAEVLLKHGANVNSKNLRGNTPLFEAVYHRRKELVLLLIRYKADVTCVNKFGQTAKTMTQDIEIFQILENPTFHLVKYLTRLHFSQSITSTKLLVFLYDLLGEDLSTVLYANPLKICGLNGQGQLKFSLDKNDLKFIFQCLTQTPKLAIFNRFQTMLIHEFAGRLNSSV